MWQNAEVVGLLDRRGRVRVVYRNEDEALIHDVVGQLVCDLLAPASVELFEQAMESALRGEETQVLLAGVADEEFVFWGRAHLRRLPRFWDRLSEREKGVVDALNATNMNAKRAARQVGISLHTLNSHRRSICRTCELHRVGEFWVFVERCR